MKHKLLVLMTALFVGVAPALGAQAPKTLPSVDVFKSPTCGCCSKWVDHMRKAGFTVHVTEVPEDAELQKIKARFGVPESAKSCHTARVAGVTIEGHVPASEVKRLLSEKPKVAGLAVPGMPMGSPGMEVSGFKPHPYNVLSFDKQGQTQVYSVQKP